MIMCKKLIRMARDAKQLNVVMSLKCLVRNIGTILLYYVCAFATITTVTDAFLFCAACVSMMIY